MLEIAELGKLTEVGVGMKRWSGGCMNRNRTGNGYDSPYAAMRTLSPMQETSMLLMLGGHPVSNLNKLLA